MSRQLFLDFNIQDDTSNVTHLVRKTSFYLLLRIEVAIIQILFNLRLDVPKMKEKMIIIYTYNKVLYNKITTLNVSFPYNLTSSSRAWCSTKSGIFL